MRYVDTRIVFREVPDEVTLAINISGCPVGCPGCHSSYLSADIGEILDEDSISGLIRENSGISCISFMGGDADPSYVAAMCNFVRTEFPGLKTCWYSGRGLEQAKEVIPFLDFLKVGPYVESAGPLDSPTTNQRFYAIRRGSDGTALDDITSRFLKKFI